MKGRDEPLTTADLAGAERDEATAAEEADRPLAPEGDAPTPASSAGGERLEPLLDAEDAQAFRSRWESIQTGFVDSPREAVEQADGLVAELMQRLAQTFNEERAAVEAQWSRGDDVSTEDLRVGLQRYRSFFERLLST